MLILMLSALPEEQQNWVEALFRKERAYFFRIASRVLGEKEVSEDAVSAAFEKIIKNIDKIWHIPSPERVPYCVSIVRRCAIDLQRKNRKYLLTELPEELPEEREELPEDILLRRDLGEALRKKIESLPSEERALLQLRYVRMYSFGQIAKLLHISEESAKKRGQRIIRRLRESLSDDATGNRNDI